MKKVFMRSTHYPSGYYDYLPKLLILLSFHHPFSPLIAFGFPSHLSIYPITLELHIFKVHIAKHIFSYMSTSSFWLRLNLWDKTMLALFWKQRTYPSFVSTEVVSNHNSLHTTQTHNNTQYRCKCHIGSWSYLLGTQSFCYSNTGLELPEPPELEVMLLGVLTLVFTTTT